MDAAEGRARRGGRRPERSVDASLVGFAVYSRESRCAAPLSHHFAQCMKKHSHTMEIRLHEVTHVIAHNARLTSNQRALSERSVSDVRWEVRRGVV
jgi:hypothetical protein